MSHQIDGFTQSSITESAMGVDDGVDKVKATDLNPFIKVALDNDATLLTRSLVDSTLKPLGSYGTYYVRETLSLVASSGIFIAPGSTKIQLQNGSTFERFGRARRRTRVIYTLDVDRTIDTSLGDSFELPSNPAATRTITLRQTSSPIPSPAELISIFVPGPILAAGIVYRIIREGAVGIEICNFVNAGSSDNGAFAEFELDGANHWRLGLNSGNAGGVVPGGHA